MKSLNEYILESSVKDEEIVNEGKGGNLTQEELDKLKDIFGDKFVIGKRGSATLIEEEDVRKYNFGRNEHGYWIRGTFNKEKKAWFPTKGWQQYPLNYDRKTGEYEFKTFDQMLSYFLAFWTKKHSK